jgi:hypothetical protein
MTFADIARYTSTGVMSVSNIAVNGGRGKNHSLLFLVYLFLSGIAVHSTTGQLMVVGVVTNSVVSPVINVYTISSSSATLTLAGTFGKDMFASDNLGLYGDDRFVHY